MAIAWNCKDDYANAGFKMLPKGDLSGIKTSLYSLVCILLLVPVSWMVYELGISREIFLIGSLMLAAMFLFYGIRFVAERSRPNARKLMFASIAYLPLVWVIMVLDQILL
jgi:protoheme IX farnesyltransferase